VLTRTTHGTPDRPSAATRQRQGPSPRVGMKTVSEFFGIPDPDFEIFRSDSPGTVFFENGIGFQHFLSESVRCFIDRFLRLLVFVENYQICVSEFSGIMSQNFFGIF
jgi:hypothetical protein